MKFYKLISRVGLLGLVLYATAIEIFRPAPGGEKHSAAPNRLKVIILTAIATAVFGIVLQGLAGVAFVTSGIYNIAADQPHFKPIAWLLKNMSSRSVRFHTEQERVPNLRDPLLVKHGLALCVKNCQPCHGAPGVANDATGRGINPKPPAFAEMSNDWTDLQLFWIVSHGLKMSGMPAFDERLSDQDRWAIVAFLRRAVLLSPADFAGLSRASETGIDDPTVPWAPDNDFGFQRLHSAGNAVRGKTLLRFYGCDTCHTVPGVGTGKVGPPLSQFAERQYIAGLLLNAPVSLVKWIRNPKQFKPITAMPNLNVPTHDATDIAAYLYTQGNPKRLNALKTAAGSVPASLQ